MSRRSRKAAAARNRSLGVLVSGRQTANGESRFSGMGKPYASIPVVLTVEEASGTSPTLAVVIEESIDGGNTWTNKLTFTTRTGPGTQTLLLTQPHRDLMRVRWTIGGTGSPSFTFAVVMNFDAI